MSSSVVSTSNVSINYTFLQNALQSVNRYTDEKAWARHFAREYFHEVNNKPGFLPVYNALLNALKTLNEEKKKEETSNKKVNKKESSSNTKPKKEKFDVEAFIKDALENMDDFNTPQEWARSYARQLFHELDRKTPFIELYNSLLNEFDKVYDPEKPIEEDYDENDGYIPPFNNEEEDEEYLPYQHKKKSSSNTFAEDGNQTDAERKQGKYMLNKVLCKEYNDWYDAFQEEAREELVHSKNNGQGEVESGDQRWIHFASKVLSRKTNIPVQTVKPVVEAWLMERNH